MHQFFERHIIPEPMSGCHLWIGAVTRFGHGTFHVKRKTVSAHRLAYEQAFGPIPEGLFVLHRCDVRCCVNPDHLFLGTQNDNMKDMAAKKRNHRGSASPSSKLTEADVFAIRASTEPYQTLAKRYGVHLQNIYMIRARKTWGHL